MGGASISWASISGASISGASISGASISGVSMGGADLVEEFLAHGPHAVIGVSQDRRKFGNKVLRSYLQAGMRVHAVHPTLAEVEGQRCWPSLAALPEPVGGLSVITPPPVTERVVEAAAAARILRLWLQPGAESEVALGRGRELGLSLIWGGPCILVRLGFRERQG
jgi:uncharacterized protein